MGFISFRHNLDGVQIIFRWVGLLKKWGLKLTSAKVEVEVEAELGNIVFNELKM